MNTRLLILMTILVVSISACSFGSSSNQSKHHSHVDHIHTDDHMMTSDHDGSVVKHDNLEISGAWARPGFEGGNSAVYMKITNSDVESEYLISANSSRCRLVEIHEIIIDGDIMRMSPVGANMLIPAGDEIVFEPGGYHLMMIDLESDMIFGDKFDLELKFRNSEDVIVSVSVPENMVE
ncbi:MAG TPA: hypothetical protein DCL76_00245 [Chloroflexi bacterium]|nr:hypothetical protein [Chloroflexota bacterium]